MKNIEQVAVVIQARLNSERTPKKMIAPFAGSNLVEICLEKLLKSKVIPKNSIYLSVHEQELINIGIQKGINVYNRSIESIEDKGITVKKIYEWYNKIPYKYFVMVNACCPLMPTETIDDFFITFINTKSEGLFGVVEKRTYYWDQEGHMVNKWPPGKLLDTKLVDPLYEAAHCLYAGSMKNIEKNIHMGTFSEKNDPELYIIKNEIEVFDIDWPWQFKFAEFLYKGIKNDLLH